MFVTCSIQSLKFCRSHHYVQRGLRLLQLLRLLHLLRLLCLLHFLRLQSLFARLATGACYTCYSCYAFFDCYTYSLSRCIIKSHEDLNQTWKIWFSTKQRSTYSLICFDQAPNNYRVFKFPWLSFYFFPALLLVCKRRREEKSEKLMVKTTLGTRTSLGYEN